MKGTQIFTIRLEPELVAAARMQIDKRNKHTREEPWNLSDFIRQAIKDKLKHYQRAKLQQRKKHEMPELPESIEPSGRSVQPLPHLRNFTSGTEPLHYSEASILLQTTETGVTTPDATGTDRQPQE